MILYLTAGIFSSGAGKSLKLDGTLPMDGLVNFLYPFCFSSHPHRGVLRGLRGFLNYNSTFNSVHNPVVSHIMCTKPKSNDSLSVIIGECNGNAALYAQRVLKTI